MKHQQKLGLKLNLPLLSYGYHKFMFVDSLTDPNFVHYWVWSDWENLKT